MSCNGSDNVTDSQYTAVFSEHSLYNEMYAQTCVMGCMHGSDSVTGFTAKPVF